ncbi:MAG: indolepyruvate oxidoreductase subunit beta family protein, partial [Rhizobacter sp.]|nr:indolepyruvate oxidoreductase subunit beta family protein [Rhizobacter sp.]
AEPVFALMPLPGDVDVVLASELMECGRAVQRGLVTPDRTTLVASTHRVYSITEKTAMGDGRVSGDALLAHARAAAKRFVRFDMAAAAEQAGSVISAVLFGALAGTGVLPFSRAQFEATIARGGVGVGPSLKAFDAAFARAAAALDEDAPAAGTATSAAVAPPATQAVHPEVRALLDRIAALPEHAHAIAREGLRRLIDYQDLAYAALYLNRVERIAAAPQDASGKLVAETARHLALWMTYEDTARVAQLKTRAERFARVRSEVRAGADQVIAIDEYLHPRVQEIAEMLPAGIGRRIERPGWLRSAVERATRNGRVVTTSSLGGFLFLRTVAATRRWRRATTRYAAEHAAIDAWLARIAQTAATHPELAVEVARCQRLVKGYSDTHARGVRSFETVMAALDKGGGRLAPATLRELRDAALADEHGEALGATLARHALA